MKRTLKTQMKKGESFEKMIADNLRSKGYLCITDVLVRNKKELGQVDLLIFRGGKIFVVECKNLNCRVEYVGKYYWNLIYEDDTIPYYSPLEQNKKHIRLLGEHFRGVELVNKVVLSDTVLFDKRNNILGLSELIDILNEISSSDMDFDNYNKAQRLSFSTVKDTKEFNTKMKCIKSRRF